MEEPGFDSYGFSSLNMLGVVGFERNVARLIQNGFSCQFKHWEHDLQVLLQHLKRFCKYTQLTVC